MNSSPLFLNLSSQLQRSFLSRPNLFIRQFSASSFRFIPLAFQTLSKSPVFLSSSLGFNSSSLAKNSDSQFKFYSRFPFGRKPLYFPVKSRTFITMTNNNGYKPLSTSSNDYPLQSFSTKSTPDANSQYSAQKNLETPASSDNLEFKENQDRQNLEIPDSEPLISSREQSLDESSRSSSFSSSSPIPDAAETKKPSKLKVLLSKYGRMSIVLYLIIGTLDLALAYLIVYFSGDSMIEKLSEFISNYIPGMSGRVGGSETVGETIPGSNETGGTFGAVVGSKATLVFVVAYSIHKLLLPLRLILTAWACPPLVRVAQRRGWKWLLPKQTV
ncbi:hypothetical protein BB560_001935 [Smittium megazygosporum]|uniref:DUF1279 domain-containing protein n=1 Tax=Smittium megazygosporum TaxID=133381 RepID=A0A2T9ZGA4_9FUNG|nr:hypothetical protein BB560_001935 [Smittium megazygosporum]